MTNVELAARLIDHFNSDDLLKVVEQVIADCVQYRNFIVYGYHQGFSADLVYSNLELEALRQHMAPYINGLYLLDPFYVAETTEQRSGLLTLSGVAPADFHESEFFLRFYSAVNVLDEAHFVVPLQPGRSVHLFVERESPQSRFDDADLGALRAIEPLVSSAVRQHWRWRDSRRHASVALPIDSAGGIDGVIRKMRPGQLTPREVEVIGLSLRGHSSKLIAHQLGISEGTVTNHKRNVYDKLSIHSQSQLFSLFLAALADGSPA